MLCKVSNCKAEKHSVDYLKLSLFYFETNCPLVNTLNTFELIFIYIADYLGLTIDLVTQSLTLCALVQASGKATVTAIEHTRKQTTVYFITDRKTVSTNI